MTLDNINIATERISGRSPSTAGFSMDGGRAQLLLTIAGGDLENGINECLGSVAPEKEGLSRQLPAAHPQYPWLFCERISNVEGIQFEEKLGYEADTGFGFDLEYEAIPLANYARYRAYEMQLEFIPRPYALLRDNQIPFKENSWWDVNDTLLAPQFFLSKQEYFRFTEMQVVPAGEYITAAAGAFLYRVNANPAGLNIQNRMVSAAQLRLFVPSTAIRFSWYQVPYSFVLSSNSYFDRYSGRVNQADWYGFPKGTLLLNSVDTLKVYTPPFPTFTSTTGNFFPSQSKLCDLQFNMTFKNPTLAAAYTPGALEPPGNIPAGHNLVPNGQTNQYYYATSDYTGQAIYPSVPFNLFFRNPDYTGGP